MIQSCTGTLTGSKNERSTVILSASTEKYIYIKGQFIRAGNMRGRNPYIAWEHILCFTHAQSFQLCPTLRDPMDCSLPGSSVHGNLQARMLEWVALPSFRGSSLPRERTHVSCIFCVAGRLFTHWVTCKALYFTYSKYLLTSYPVLGIDLSAGDMATNKVKYLVSWNLYSRDIDAYSIEI